MRRASALAFGLMLAVSPLALSSASAQTLEAALSSAYRSNPDLNATRASLRAVDEGIASAMSGYRPRITGSADYGISVTDSRSSGERTTTDLNPAGLGLSVSQTLYNGGRTGNSVRAAESNVLASRETLRNTEQNTLLDAVTAYMNVLRDTAILSLRQNNVNVLAEQVRQTKDRFAVG
ncbi:MAG: TolC family protein, partial [Methylobacterium sp.]